MIIFKNEDRAYLSWVRRHRDGFVLDVLKNRGHYKTVLHRASCGDIRLATTKRTYWTTGRHIKACSDKRDELTTWWTQRTGAQSQLCAECTPQLGTLGVRTDQPSSASRLSKLGRDILSYVVETSVISMDNPGIPYVLVVDDVARYVDKSVPQITGTTLSLVANNWIRLKSDRICVSDPPVRPAATILPTANALRTLPAFAELTDEEIHAELDSLEVDPKVETEPTNSVLITWSKP